MPAARGRSVGVDHQLRPAEILIVGLVLLEVPGYTVGPRKGILCRGIRLFVSLLVSRPVDAAIITTGRAVGGLGILPSSDEAAWGSDRHDRFRFISKLFEAASHPLPLQLAESFEQHPRSLQG